MVTLPIVAEGAHFSFVTELSGTAFTFEFRWNRRDSGWYVHLGDAEGNPLAQGVRVVLGLPLFGGPKPGFPAGAVVARDLTGQDVDATQDDLGQRVVLYFIPAAELA